ncbi:MAG TPA: porin [Phycisphaerales bacterium]|nr:porin [Phycisphaerales bacterium]
MNRTRMLALLAGAAMGAGVASAQTADTSALERELLADAGARASFQAGGTSGHDGSFFVGSADGNYRLEIGGYTQFRYFFNNRDTEGVDEDFTNGFDMTRAALEFGGNVINPQLTYYIRGYFDTAGEDGSFDLADAYGAYTFDSGLTVTWGQFLAPITRERLVDERYQLAADRSITNNVFEGGYTQGLALSYSSDNFRIVGSLNDGVSTANTPYYSPAEADWAVTGRAEFKWSGDWDQFQDFTSWRGTEGYAGMVGAAVHWQTAGDTGNTTTFAGGAPTEMDLLEYTVDLSVEGNGWNAFGAFVGNSLDIEGGSDTDNFGALIQAGVFVTDQFELFGRWDAIFPDDDITADDDDDYHTITFGGNYYFVAGSHAAKFTADVQWSLDEQPALAAIGGVVPDHTSGTLPTSEADQWMVRLQMQLVF